MAFESDLLFPHGNDYFRDFGGTYFLVDKEKKIYRPVGELLDEDLATGKRVWRQKIRDAAFHGWERLRRSAPDGSEEQQLANQQLLLWAFET